VGGGLVLSLQIKSLPRGGRKAIRRETKKKGWGGKKDHLIWGRRKDAELGLASGGKPTGNQKALGTLSHSTVRDTKEKKDRYGKEGE